MINKLLKSADEQIGQEQWQAAVDLLTKCFNLDPDNLEVLEKRAHCYHKLNKLAKAVNDYNHYLRIEPNNEELAAKRDLVQTILKNSQLDIFACTNTHLDPWN